MKKLVALTAVTVLSSLGVAQAQLTVTDLVQTLNFNLTALSQGPSSTNASGVVANTVTSTTITSSNVIQWIGDATGTTFNNATLLVITPLTPGAGGPSVVIRQTINGGNSDTDVTSFFSRLSGNVILDGSTVNPANGAVNGTFYDVDGFVLQDAMGFTLPAHFSVSGISTVTVTSLTNKKGKLTGVITEHNAENVSGTGDFNGSPTLIKGRVGVSGRTTVVVSSPGV